MKNPTKGKRRERRTGQSPYARHHKAPYQYPFPTGKEAMKRKEREAMSATGNP